MFTLVIYCIGLQYGILMFDSQGPGRWALISCRIFVYTLSLGQLLVKHSYSVVKAVRKKNITMARGCIPLPTYLLNSNQETYEFVLLLFLICQVSIEPFLHCLQVDDSWYTNCCYADAKWCELSDGYDRLTVAPQIIYFFLFAEIAHMSLKFSSFYIVCMQILNDLQLYFVALIWWTATVAAGIACLPQCLKGTQARDFYNWSSSFQSLLAIGLNAYGDSQGIAESPETLLLWCVFLFAFGWHVFFLNVLIAQFCKSFNIASEHAFGKAYLVRAQNIFGTVMPLISTKRWLRFVASLKLDEPCELDEGDLGPSGAVKAVEPADANAALAGKNIRRFGGLTSASLPWTAERAFEEDEDTAVERLQKLMSARFNEVERMMKALTEQSARELNSQLRLSTASEELGSDMLQPQLSVPEEFGQLFDSREESEDQHLPEITRDVFV
ncbi:unnamed protein product [Polarella glacialis]|uniref:Uncharacterized protein n=1 Tax=Polarella glacialis TaxID=89957 RepID=A0A813JTF6_POLGL|nr:unnamed protein product [Polarella glacialis]